MATEPEQEDAYAHIDGDAARYPSRPSSGESTEDGQQEDRQLRDGIARLQSAHEHLKGARSALLNTRADPDGGWQRVAGQLIEQADAILARDACLNFFAGPTDTSFSAKLNFYNVHMRARTSPGPPAALRKT